MDSTYRTHNQLPGTVTVCGAFRPNGSSSPLNNNNPSATVSRVSTGLYRVTLPFGANSVRSLHVDLRMASQTNLVVARVVGAVTCTASSFSFDIEVRVLTLSAGPTLSYSLTDLTADANQWISWVAVLDNGTVP